MNNLTSKNAAVAFGDFIRICRVKNGITARDASTICNMLPSNFSKLEHGALCPPKDPERQKALAKAIGITEDSEESNRFFDLAGEATNALPVDLAEIISRDDAMPLLLRTIKNQRLTSKQVDRLIQIVRGV